MLIAERQILAALRDHTFFNVAGLNEAIRPLLAKLNAQPFQKLEGSRDSWFEAYEKSKLLPLPATPFEPATWSQASVNIDYHVVVDKHYYSVPYQLIHQTLDVRLTESTVELFQHGKRAAAHARSSRQGLFTTLNEHRPKAHQKHLEWTPGRIVQWAQKTGPSCAEVVRQILESKPHPEQGYRACLVKTGKVTGAKAIVKALEAGEALFQVGAPLLYQSDLIFVLAVTFLFLRRLINSNVRYISLPADYFPLFLILAIGVTGVLMRYFTKTDIVSVKMLTMGLISFRPAVPETIGGIFFSHLFLLSVLFLFFPLSKLVHMGGVFLSPTRNMANNSRAKRHVNPWNYPVHVHTYEEYENDFRAKMKEAGLPVEKE